MPRTSRCDWRLTKERNEARCARILETAAPLITDDLAWEAVGDVAVEPGVIESLVYMRDVEGFTDSYLVGMAAHRTTLSDPLVSRFLDIWLAEEAGHARAIARYLDLYASKQGCSIPAQQPSPTTPPPIGERILARLGGPVGRLVAAAHMTWGAANELLTLNGYRLLADRCDDPVLAELLARIAAQESRHYSFYLLQAEWRLASSPHARIVLPRLMRDSWTPVGVGPGYKSTAEFRRVLAFLGTGAKGERIIDRMDRRFAALPGLAKLQIYRRAAA